MFESIYAPNGSGGGAPTIFISIIDNLLKNPEDYNVRYSSIWKAKPTVLISGHGVYKFLCIPKLVIAVEHIKSLQEQEIR